MGIQSLRKDAITSPQELLGFNLSTQTRQKRTYNYFNQINSVIFIRWISIFFCLAFWYGIYKLVTLFIA
jgi:hypothetical protein